MPKGQLSDSPLKNRVRAALEATGHKTVKAFAKECGISYGVMNAFLGNLRCSPASRLRVMTALRDHLGLPIEETAKLAGCNPDGTIETYDRQSIFGGTSKDQIATLAARPFRVEGYRSRNLPALSPDLAATAQRVRDLINFGHPWPGYGAQKPTGSFPSELRQIWDVLRDLDERAKKRCRFFPTPSLALWRIAGYNRSPGWLDHNADPVMARLELAALRIALRVVAKL